MINQRSIKFYFYWICQIEQLWNRLPVEVVEIERTNQRLIQIRIACFYRNLFRYPFISFSWYEFIQTFCTEINTCHTLVDKSRNFILGVNISDAEVCLNVLGDLGVVGDEEEEEDMVLSPFEVDMLSSPLERRHLRAKRCSSTPRWLLSFPIHYFSTTNFPGLENYHRQQMVVNTDWFENHQIKFNYCIMQLQTAHTM